ncbi:hypothetical protein LOK49_LG06G02340 [Camellia lanceoleosa]|uniref:Uncharacterized protein n=1 Tax=Camellia lanceoleosa TaxID=1840588 RepID=A0ACC0HHY9_9ERIC|nr:hypothetical protein LOK49_LG06G02340 [Camellia lanceoleosa]
MLLRSSLAKVITDRETGKSRGFGFVNFSSDESAGSAMSAMDEQPLNGWNIRVSFANDRPSAPRGNFGGGGYGSMAGCVNDTEETPFPCCSCYWMFAMAYCWQLKECMQLKECDDGLMVLCLVWLVGCCVPLSWVSWGVVLQVDGYGWLLCPAVGLLMPTQEMSWSELVCAMGLFQVEQKICWLHKEFSI